MMNFWQIVLFLLGIAITIRYSGIAQTSSNVPGAPTPNAANAKPSLNQWILAGAPAMMGNPIHPTTAAVNQTAASILGQQSTPNVGAPCDASPACTTQFCSEAIEAGTIAADGSCQPIRIAISSLNNAGGY